MEKPEFLEINLRRRLDDLGWSYKKFSMESGVSYHTIFRALSKGITPRGENLQKMAKAVGLTVAELWKDPTKELPAPAKTVGDLTPDELVEKLSGISRRDDLELARVLKENKELMAYLPSEFAIERPKVEPWQRGLACFFLTGNREYLKDVKEEVRKSVLSALRFYELHPKKKVARR